MSPRATLGQCPRPGLRLPHGARGLEARPSPPSCPLRIEFGLGRGRFSQLGGREAASTRSRVTAKASISASSRSARPNPQDAIGSAQPRLGPGALEQIELVPRNQVLEHEVMAGVKAINKDAKHQHEELNTATGGYQPQRPRVRNSGPRQWCGRSSSSRVGGGSLTPRRPQNRT